jgi:hypothetical protein
MFSSIIVFDTVLVSGIDEVELHCREAPELGRNLIWKNAVFVNFH